MARLLTERYEVGSPKGLSFVSAGFFVVFSSKAGITVAFKDIFCPGRGEVGSGARVAGAPVPVAVPAAQRGGRRSRVLEQKPRRL